MVELFATVSCMTASRVSNDIHPADRAQTVICIVALVRCYGTRSNSSRSQMLVSVHIEFTTCKRHTCLAGQYVYFVARRVRDSTCDRFTYFAYL